MANSNPVKYDKPLTIRVDQEFLDAADELRAAERPVISRSEMIRKALFEARARQKKARAR